jgi:hypothetical protein
MNNHDFIDKLLQKPLGVIVLCNILDGLDAGLYGENFVRDAMDSWREDFLRREGENEDKRLSGSLDSLVTRPASASGRPAPCLRLRCQVTVAEALAATSYAHSMLADSFIRHVLHPDDQAFLVREGVLGTGPTPRFLEHSISQTVRIGHAKCIGSPFIPDKVVFLAPFDDVSPLLANASKANAVRDRLGLVHRKRDDELVLLELPGKDLAVLQQGRPSFVDAGSHRRFKAVASNAVNQGKADWGFTLDLEGFANTGAPTDGVRERVCEQISADRVSSIRLHPLGRVTSADRGTSPMDDNEAYAKSICGGRSLEAIATRMKGIV